MRSTGQPLVEIYVEAQIVTDRLLSKITYFTISKIDHATYKPRGLIHRKISCNLQVSNLLCLLGHTREVGQEVN